MLVSDHWILHSSAIIIFLLRTVFVIGDYTDDWWHRGYFGCCFAPFQCTVQYLQLEHLLPSLDWISLAFDYKSSHQNNNSAQNKRRIYLAFLSIASPILFYQCFDQSPDLVFHVIGLTPGTQYSLRIAFYGNYNYCCPILSCISISPFYQYINAMKIKMKTFLSLSRVKLFWRELGFLPNGTQM